MARIRKEPTVEEFLKQVADHQMIVRLDSGMHRSILFRKPDRSYYLHFTITTWPGYLCISGDMGCYVFSRLPDMFQFFRSEREGLYINPQYWAEKCEAADKRGHGIEEWDEEIFRQTIKERFDSYFEDSEVEQSAKDECWQEITDKVLRSEGEHEAMRAAMDFTHQYGPGKRDTFEFHDFWECNCKTYTYHFIWICYAIQWAIRQYDSARTPIIHAPHDWRAA